MIYISIYKMMEVKPQYKPVLFSCVVSACIGLPDLGCQNSNDIHKQDKV